QYARDLAPPRRSGGAWRDDVVRPLDLERQSGCRANTLRNRDTAGERQVRCRHNRADDDRQVETGTSGRIPGTSQTAAARRLRRGDDGSSLRGATLSVAGRDVVGGTSFVE